MATPSELSLEEIRKYLIENGGSARNHDLVKHFKKFLTDPDTRVEARNKFKDYVNSLATIKNEEYKFANSDKESRAIVLLTAVQVKVSALIDEILKNIRKERIKMKNEGEKYLVLKKKYRNEPLSLATNLATSSSSSTIGIETPNTAMIHADSMTSVSPLREPPPYRSPPLASPIISSPNANETNESEALYQEIENGSSKIDEDNVAQTDENSEIGSPPVPPRRKSQDKLRIENNNKENVVPVEDKSKSINTEASTKEDDGPTSATTSAEQLTVRERMQRFNKMASETDLQGRINGSTTPTKKRSDKGADEDDRASVASQLDGKSREWLVRAAQGDYQALAKLAAEEPRLARLRTALHWGAKHGNEDIVKLIAGTYKDYIKGVNEATNGGYTPLHIAMQFDHENIFNLLVQVYGANQELRDYSGKKARQYLASQEAAVSQDTFRKIKARKKHAEKDLGFLRIGSLNVRVKRTTEAFSQFLGVASSNAAISNEKIHKSWGSADNIQTEHKVMPPPKYAPIKKRRSKRAQDFVSSRDEPAKNQPNNNPHIQGQGQNPGHPRRGSQQPRSVTNLAVTSSHPQNDSDSDNACGFDSAWRGSALM